MAWELLLVSLSYTFFVRAYVFVVLMVRNTWQKAKIATTS